jgi:Domain of unknown function (DUF3303)
MLFMVVETFAEGNLPRVGQRFQEKGRMLPDGVSYQVSWMEVSGRRCFQIMEAASRELLDEWIACWNDLVDFEIVPVMTSTEFWKVHKHDGQSAQG